MKISGDEIKRAAPKNLADFTDLFELLRDLHDRGGGRVSEGLRNTLFLSLRH